MVRRLVIIVVIVAVALAVALLSRTQEDARGAPGEVLRHDGGPAALPSFDADTAPSQPVVALPDVAPMNAAPALVHADDLALTITVLHADGVPAAGCLVVVAPMQGKPWTATTDLSGSVAGPATESTGILWIDGPLLAPASYALSIRRGALTIRLPAGEVLEGRVLVDGAPPQAPFALGLGPRDASTDLAYDIETLLARPELGDAAVDDRPGLLVREDGAFRFSGLPAGWSGRFSLPGNMTPADGEDLAAVSGDRARTLRLHRMPRILVRFLLPTGEPAAGAHVEATTRAEGGSNGYSLTAGEDGRTDFPINPFEPIQTVDLAAVAAAGDARADLTRPLPDPSRDFDLGDVRLDPAWTLRFRALDAQGAPLAGAIGATACPHLVQSGTTGSDGIGQLAGVQAGCAELRVGAPRHEIASVALPAQPPVEPIDVVLTSCAHLEAQVVPADGHARPGLMVSFHTVTHGSRWLNDSEFDRAAQLLGTTDSPRSSYTTTTGPGASKDVDMRRDYLVPDTGLVVIGCVEPGDPLDLQLVDCTRYVLWTSKTFTLQPAEQSVVTIPVSAVPSSLVVLVTDESGAPLSDARVKVFAPPPLSPLARMHVDSVETGADGQCTFGNLYSPTVDVECSHSGFAATKLSAVAAAGITHVVLRTGLTVTVHVVDEQGRPVPVPYVGARRADRVPLQQDATRLDAPTGEDDLGADWRFQDLPDVELEFSVHLSGRIIRSAHDPHVPEARLVVPATGCLVVRGLRADDAELHPRLMLERTDGEKDNAESWPDLGLLTTGSYRWPLLLPGSYRVSLERAYDAAAGRQVLRGPVLATVRAGEETTVDLP